MNINLSEKLLKEAEKTVAQHFNDIVVIVDNTLTVDWHNGKDRVNFIFSCTKSILSLLIGILLENNKEIRLDTPITNHITLLQEFGCKYQNITIKNLLSMTSGIDWCDMRSNFDYNRMVKNNWLEYVTSKEVISSKIGQFNYCDGNSLLLLAIITEYSGLSSHEYAKQFLFKPLGIEKTKWKEQNGISMGGAGLHMLSLDLAKIGNLIINNGIYENNKILNSEWIKIMGAVQSDRYPEWFWNYGLHWWISQKETNKHINMFYALGHMGSICLLYPKKERRFV
jgi:CubicO group peptidase (beta-lactamase class C family)